MKKLSLKELNKGSEYLGELYDIQATLEEDIENTKLDIEEKEIDIESLRGELAENEKQLPVINKRVKEQVSVLNDVLLPIVFKLEPKLKRRKNLVTSLSVDNNKVSIDVFVPSGDILDNVYSITMSDAEFEVTLQGGDYNDAIDNKIKTLQDKIAELEAKKRK